MEYEPVFVYFPDPPREESPFVDAIAYCHPLHLYFPTDAIPSFWRALVPDGWIQIHESSLPHGEVERLLQEWGQWAETHDELDWKALEAYQRGPGAPDSETPHRLSKEIKGRASITRPSFPAGMREALLLALARRLRGTVNEYHRLYRRIEEGERKLHSLLGTPEAEPGPVSSFLDSVTIDWNEIARLQLEAWGFFYAKAPQKDPILVTLETTLFEFLSEQEEAVPIGRAVLPLPERRPASRQGADAEFEEAAAAWRRCLGSLGDSDSGLGRDATGLSDLKDALRSASETLRKPWGGKGTNGEDSAAVQFDVCLVATSFLLRLLGKGPEGTDPGIEACFRKPWTAIALLTAP